MGSGLQSRWWRLSSPAGSASELGAPRGTLLSAACLDSRRQMRPSRTQVVLVVLAVLGIAPQLLLGFQGFDVVESITQYYLILIVATLLWYGLALGYGYRLGRDGQAGSPLTVARQYLVAGVVGLAVVFAVQAVLGHSLQFDEPVRTLAMLGNFIIQTVLPFVFAGLAGVPLGAMAAGEDATNTDAAAQGADA